MLDTRLQNDSIELGHFLLCTVLLSKDAHYPWLILVPQRENISEIFELSQDDQEQLMWESSYVAKTLKQTFNADKVNVAAIGNVVKQLHVHHVFRFEDDATWPKPIWSMLPAKKYETEQLKQTVASILNAFAGSVFVPNEQIKL